MPLFWAIDLDAQIDLIGLGLDWGCRLDGIGTCSGHTLEAIRTSIGHDQDMEWCLQQSHFTFVYLGCVQVEDSSRTRKMYSIARGVHALDDGDEDVHA